ncbi:EFR1 family ferrodoxin [Sinanaerobacter sp. ZZT-01]|uniref:EFR1 family ferrodoxin n=1 Tax=Sinanaerobacter sp. ZZT-01 TaxID=3111540 RepID=UPI002D768833|nr:EFR1 family ferrodoxin [Sinanaerobacter sp. ZZT-01]WRR93035.1 EFR1 family ferrodoxin [Sinanaerobacter sp. ZZT-01]
MKLKNIYAVYFSATGTTEKIVTRIARGLSNKLKLPISYIDFTLPKAREEKLQFSKEDIVIFGTPVYAGRVPNVLLPYLTNDIKGGGALAIPIVLYGNRNYDDALIELRNILEENKCHTIGGGAFIGEHSFSYTLAAHRPDEKDLKVADEFAEKICTYICEMSEAPSKPAFVKGEDPIRPYYTPRDRKGNPVNILKVKPKTKDNCTQCGICAEVCPMGSISREDVTQYIGICIKCGACVKKCPEGAKYYDDEKYLYHQHELEDGFARRAEPEFFIG